MIRDAARKAVTENTIGDYVFFWMYAPAGQQEHAKKILREEIHLAARHDVE